ncbi:hypothetical protein LguiA_000269 [Lonicera macranthoides]
MEEQQMSQLAVTHLLQHTLRSWCIHDHSQWVYAVFWRILPRNYPPPKWDSQGGAYDRSRGNRRNWILAWEDGFCNFAAAAPEMEAGDQQRSVYHHEYHQQQPQLGLQPELFFKMSHEIYNYGEGLIGKVAADHSHKWIYKEPNNAQEINLLSAWNNSADSHPRTWEAQFQSGINTIALIAVREGVIQLGSVHKVIEDLSYVVLLRKKFSYIESIPGALLPHPSSSSYPFHHPDSWHFQPNIPPPPLPPPELCHHFNHQPPPIGIITPSMSSLEALLSKLPSVVPVSASTPATSAYCEAQPHYVTTSSSNRSMEVIGSEKVVAKEEEVEDKDVGESSNSMQSYHHHHEHFSNYHNSNINHHHHLNVTSSSMPNNGY